MEQKNNNKPSGKFKITLLKNGIDIEKFKKE